MTAGAQTHKAQVIFFVFFFFVNEMNITKVVDLNRRIMEIGIKNDEFYRIFEELENNDKWYQIVFCAGYNGNLKVYPNMKNSRTSVPGEVGNSPGSICFEDIKLFACVKWMYPHITCKAREYIKCRCYKCGDTLDDETDWKKFCDHCFRSLRETQWPNK